jgi:hypothetical protein
MIRTLKYISVFYAMILLLTVVLIGCGPNPKPYTPPEPKVEEIVNEINSRLHFLLVKKSAVPIFPSRKASNSYVITVKEEHLKAVYYFKVYEYIIETGGDPALIPTSSICEMIDSVYNQEEPIFELVRKLRTTGKLSFFNFFELEIENLQEVVVELLYAIRKFQELKSKKIDILVKGYADGQIANWDRNLLPPPYNYTTIQYYPTLDIGSVSPVNYNPVGKPFLVPNKYKNNHLPNLRANFIKEEFIDKFIQACMNQNISVNILEGYEYSTPNNPLNRKVQVFIYIH